jgi:hypothetical protein
MGKCNGRKHGPSLCLVDTLILDRGSRGSEFDPHGYEVSRPGFDGDIEDPEGSGAWLHHGSTRTSCVSGHQCDPARVQGTLMSQGWKARTVGDGSVELFEMNGAKYALRDKNSSGYDGWTADFTPSGSKERVLEIRLGYSK